MAALHEKTATECVAMLKQGEVSPLELIDAALARMDAVDGAVNALPERCIERARAQAGQVSIETTLAGLPIAVKDYNDVGGVRTTYGSPIFEHYVPAQSDVTVQRLEANGAIPVAKSNVPEWAGGNTFNPVYGATRNPWNLALSAGGSSGGSAAALASGQIWLATGNDLGGSLRTPASFNGIVGLRPGPGRVPRGIRLEAFDALWVEGPMGRCVSDVALMLDAGCGADIRDPLSFNSDSDDFTGAAAAALTPHRIGYSRDLGVVPVANEVAAVTDSAMSKCAGMGVDVTGDIPDFSGAIDGFQTLRGVLLATMMGGLLEQHRDHIAPEIIGNVELGLNISPQQIFEAQRCRWELHQRITTFFEHHDLMVCPAVSIKPFPVEQRYVEQIDGKALETYIDWFAITFALSMSACPVLSLPCGFSDDGLPIGIQIMGKPRGEASLLAYAARLEQLFDVATRLPVDPQRLP